MQKRPGFRVEPVGLLPPVSLHHLRYQVLCGVHVEEKLPAITCFSIDDAASRIASVSRRPDTLATIGGRGKRSHASEGFGLKSG